tara:strand:+ start:167 stop:346 length:180 start_codon:yes stop_codon:yes gene_type:complete
MKQRSKIFIITFIIVTAFVFGFYYLDTHKVFNSLKLGAIGGIVIAAMAALLVPFVIKKR